MAPPDATRSYSKAPGKTPCWLRLGSATPLHVRSAFPSCSLSPGPESARSGREEPRNTRNGQIKCQEPLSGTLVEESRFRILTPVLELSVLSGAWFGAMCRSSFALIARFAGRISNSPW